MLTPSFNVSQTTEFLIISIHAPYTQLKEVEINALGTEFWFYSSPYYLRLNFPYELVDDDEPPASFDSDKGDFEVKLTKKESGQHFPDLDLLGSLLAPKNTKLNIKPSIEVISGCEEQSEASDEDEDEWVFEQLLPSYKPDGLLNVPKYGFGNLNQGVFRQVQTEFKEIIDLPEPDDTPECERELLRRAEEGSKFDSDHYLADWVDEEGLKEILEYTPYWMEYTTGSVHFTDIEKEDLKRLGNKEFLLSKEETTAVWLSLVDIVFAFAYNHRATCGENNVESAWTINKLSATLSWFNVCNTPKSVVVTNFRRALTYPLYRSWELAKTVLQDIIAVFRHGRRQLLKCLLEIHRLFSSSEPRYLLNQLYITDYCIWLQKISDHKLAKFTDALEKILISKQDVEFDLEELEEAALLVQDEERENDLAGKVNNISLIVSEEETSSSSGSSGGDTDISDGDLDSDDTSSSES